MIITIPTLECGTTPEAALGKRPCYIGTIIGNWTILRTILKT